MRPSGTSTRSPATLGPGLIGSLLVGVAEAKSIAAVLDVPFVGVNHLEAHIYSNLLADAEAKLPGRGADHLGRPHHAHSRATVTATTSSSVERSTMPRARRSTRSRASSASTTRGAPRSTGSRCSAIRTPFEFPRAMIDEPGFDVSYSGLKTSVINYVRKMRGRGRRGLGRGHRGVVPAGGRRHRRSPRRCRPSTTRWSGDGLPVRRGRRELRTADRASQDACADRRDHDATCPRIELCTDNAAMVAACGTAMLRRGLYTGLDAAPDPNLPLVPLAELPGASEQAPDLTVIRARATLSTQAYGSAKPTDRPSGGYCMATATKTHQAARGPHPRPPRGGRGDHRIGHRDPRHRQGEAPGGHRPGRRPGQAVRTPAT